MFKSTILSALVAAVLALPAVAGNTVELTEENVAKIRQMLTEEGYEVEKVKLEDGLYEAYARKDGHKYEVFLDADFAHVRTELDD